MTTPAQGKRRREALEAFARAGYHSASDLPESVLGGWPTETRPLLDAVLWQGKTYAQAARESKRGYITPSSVASRVKSVTERVKREGMKALETDMKRAEAQYIAASIALFEARHGLPSNSAKLDPDS